MTISPTVPHEVPPPPADFTGREADIEELLDSVLHGGVTITGLRGMGGIGKTALALKLAEQLAASFPDGQIYLDLKGASDAPISSVEAIAHVIRAFNPQAQVPEKVEEARSSYLSALGDKKALLLMDNALNAEQIKPLIPPKCCALIVTSRNNFMIPGLKLRNLDTMPPEDARELLLEIEENIGESADRIAELCGYLPLALRAAATTLGLTAGLSPSKYAEQLEDERNRLSRFGTKDADLSVVASLELSYGALDEKTALAFRQMSVFPGSFDEKAESAVCEDHENDFLNQLERRSLVQFDSKSERFKLHDLVRVFAAQKASGEERAEAELRHAVHYEAVLGEAKRLYKQGKEGVLRGLGLFDLEWVNLRAGQTWARSQPAENKEALKLCNSYPDSGVYVLSLRQHPKERIEWLEAALEASRKLQDRASEGVHLGNLGLAYYYLGEYRRAIEFHQQSLKNEREIGHRSGEGNALGNLGNAYHSLGEFRRAIEFHERHLEIAREIGDRRGEGAALGNLGLAYNNLGEYRRAIDYYEQQLSIAREIGDRLGEGNALWNMSLTLDTLGERDRAIAHAAEALKILEAIESPYAARVRSQLAKWRGDSPATPNP